MGNYKKAEPLIKKTLELRRKTLGVEHHDTLVSMNNLATLQQNTGEYAKAKQLYEELLSKDKKIIGTIHTLSAMSNLATLHQHMGEYEEAKQLHEETLTIR